MIDGNRVKKKNNDFLIVRSWQKTRIFGKFLLKAKIVNYPLGWKTRSWDDKEGKKHYHHRGIVEEFSEFAGKQEKKPNQRK